jgi:hypothetical protein
VLIAYVIDPFLESTAGAIATGHTHHLESVLMVRTWLERGFAVDVIDFQNSEFQPKCPYQFFVSARVHLAQIAGRLNAGCIKIAHLDTSHFAVNNSRAWQRLVELQLRRGISLPASIRLIEPNSAIEAADVGVVLGNETTMATYEYAGKPLHSLVVPAAIDPPWTDRQPLSNRGSFVWLGSGGLVHKGLDLVLEAFAHCRICACTCVGRSMGNRSFWSFIGR